MTNQNLESTPLRVLIPRTEIQAKIEETGRQISRDYAGKPLLLVGILNGAFVFMADLCRAISIPCEVAFLRAQSYTHTTSSGTVQISADLGRDLSRYHVILAEDVIDTGRTLYEVLRLLNAQNPLSLRLIALLDKPERRVVPLQADLSLFYHPRSVRHRLWSRL